MRETKELEHQIRTGRSPDILDQPAFSGPELAGYLADVLAERKWKVKDAIRVCNLERCYGYQLFNGTRRPTRQVLLRLALTLGLTEEECQRLLKIAGKPVLYPRSRYDAAVLYGLTHGLGLIGTDELLESLGQERLL